MSFVAVAPSAEMNVAVPQPDVQEPVHSVEIDAMTVQSCKDDLVSLKKEIEADLEKSSGKTRADLEAIIDSLDLERLEAMSEDELVILKNEVEELREQAIQKKDEKKGLMKMFSRFGFKKRGNKHSIESKPSHSSIASKGKPENASVAEEEAPVIESNSSKLSVSSKRSVSSKKATTSKEELENASAPEEEAPAIESKLSKLSVSSKRSVSSKKSTASKISTKKSATAEEDNASVVSKVSLEKQRSVASAVESVKDIEAPIPMSRSISKTTVTSSGDVELEAVGQEENVATEAVEQDKPSEEADEGSASEASEPIAEEEAEAEVPETVKTEEEALAAPEAEGGVEEEQDIKSVASEPVESVKDIEAPIPMSRTISKTTVTSSGDVELEAVGQEENDEQDKPSEEADEGSASEASEPIAEEEAEAEAPETVEAEEEASAAPEAEDGVEEEQDIKSVASEAKSIASKKSVMSESISVASKKSIASKR